MFAMELPMMSRVVLASMKLAMERDFVSDRFRVPERGIAEVFNRPQQAPDPGSVQTVDRVPDAELFPTASSPNSQMRWFKVLFPTRLHLPQRYHIIQGQLPT